MTQEEDESAIPVVGCGDDDIDYNVDEDDDDDGKDEGDKDCKIVQAVIANSVTQNQLRPSPFVFSLF